MGIRHVSEEGLSFNTDSKKSELNTTSRAFGKISDVPDTPSIANVIDIGSNQSYNNGAAYVTISAAATGGSPTSYTVTSNPGSFTGTGTSPVTVRSEEHTSELQSH